MNPATPISSPTDRTDSARMWPDAWQRDYWSRLGLRPGLQAVIDPNDHQGLRNQRTHDRHEAAIRPHLPARINRVLDFGCGNGRWFPLLAEHADSYLGADAVAGMLADHPGPTWALGPPPFPWPDAHFDLIFCFWVCQHITDDRRLAAVFDEFARLLTADGRILLVERAPGTGGAEHEAGQPRAYIRHREPRRYAELLADAGLGIRFSEPVDDGRRAPTTDWLYLASLLPGDRS